MEQGRQERVLKLERSRGVAVKKAGMLVQKKVSARDADMAVVPDKAREKAKAAAKVAEKANKNK